MYFWKIISSHTHALFQIFFFSMLWGEVASNFVVFQKFIFLQFRSIESVFRSIEIVIKNFSEFLSVSIDRNFFSINRISWISFFFFFFFKFSVWPVQNTFSKVFSIFLSLSDSAKQNHPIFVVFLQIFCNIFLSQSR